MSPGAFRTFVAAVILTGLVFAGSVYTGAATNAPIVRIESDNMLVYAGSSGDVRVPLPKMARVAQIQTYTNNSNPISIQVTVTNSMGRRFLYIREYAVSLRSAGFKVDGDDVGITAVLPASHVKVTARADFMIEVSFSEAPKEK
jgi:hypothetical protein